MPRTQCPKCREWEPVSAEDFGRIVNCRSCGAVFPAIESPESDEESGRRSVEEGWRRRLSKNSRALVKLGTASLFACCLAGAGYFIAGLTEFRVLRGNNTDSILLMLLGVLTAVPGSIYCLLIVIGSTKMIDPRHRAWPIAAAILASAAVVICLPIPVLNLLLAFHGVRALRRLFQRDLRHLPLEEGPPADDPGGGAGLRGGRPFPAYFGERYDPEDSNERAAVTAEALRRVKTPATGLIATGLTGMAASVIVGLVVTANQFRGGQADFWNAAVSLGTFITIAFYFFLVATGGRSLGRLQHRAIGVTGAILAVASIGFCGVWSVVSIPGVIFGVWALTALGSREVQHAMRWIREERDERM
jgi:hypothetical protein